MKTTNILKALMKNQGIGNAVLGKRIGLAHNVVYQRINQKNISVNALNQMLSAMDYKIVIVPASRRMKEDEYEITTDNTKGKRPPYMTEDGKIKLTEV